MQPAAKLRALFALKNVLRALKSKRFVVEAPEAVVGLSQAGARSAPGPALHHGLQMNEAGQSQACALCHLCHQLLLQA